MGKADGTEAEKRKKSKSDRVLGTWLPSSLLRYTRGETAGVSGEGAVNTTHHFLHAIQVRLPSVVSM